MFDKLIEKLMDELLEMNKKAGSGQDLSEKEYECSDIWAHTLKSLVTVEAMFDADDEWDQGGSRRSGRYSRDGGMSRSGNRSYMLHYRGTRRGSRDDGGYSYHDGDDSMAKLQEAYDNASTEQERKTIRKLMDQMGY